MNYKTILTPLTGLDRTQATYNRETNGRAATLFMRLLLLVLTFTAATGVARADEVTLDLKNKNSTITSDPVSLDLSHSNPESSSDFCKVAKGEYFTLSVTSGYVISNITINYTAKDYSPSKNNTVYLSASPAGTSFDAKATDTSSTWAGNASSVLFTNGDSSNGSDLRITEIVVTYVTDSGGETPTPTISITAQPVSGSHLQFSAVTPLSVTASASNGATCTYQWQESSSENGSYTDIQNATNSTYTPANTTVTKKWYQCIVSAENCENETSSKASVEITGGDNTISNLVQITENYVYTPNAAIPLGTLTSDGKVLSAKGGSNYTSNGLNIKDNRYIAISVAAGATLSVQAGNHGTNGDRTLYISKTVGATNESSLSIPQGNIETLTLTPTEESVYYIHASSDLYIKQIDVIYTPVPVMYTVTTQTGSKASDYGQSATLTAKVDEEDVTSVAEGTSVTFEAQETLLGGIFKFSHWKFNGGEDVTDRTTTQVINENTTAVAYYNLTYRVAMGEATGGTAYATLKGASTHLNSTDNIDAGTEITITAVPDATHTFDHWSVVVKNNSNAEIFKSDNWTSDNPYTFSLFQSTFESYSLTEGEGEAYDITVTPVYVQGKTELTEVRLMGNQSSSLFELMPGQTSNPVILLVGTDNSDVNASNFEFVSSDPEVATITFRMQQTNKDRITLNVTAGTKAGTTTITPNFLGNATLNAKTGTPFTITVTDIPPSDIQTTGALKANKNVWTPTVNKTLDLSTYLTSSSTGAYSITCSPEGCATLDGNILTAKATGTVTINQAADANYRAGSVDIHIVTGSDNNKTDRTANTYTVTAGQKVNDGTDITLEHITMTYGEDGFWGVGATDGHGNYIASQTNPVVSGNVATAGTYYKFRADSPGILVIDVKCNSNRSIYFAAESEQLTGKEEEGNAVGNGSKFSDLYQGNITFEIEANKYYYLYAKSTKLSVYGFTFLPDVLITFAAGEGSGTMGAQFVKNGVPTTLNKNTLTPPAGKVFNYWSSTTGATYGDEAAITATSDVTLTANWKEDDHKHDVALVAFSVTSTKLNKNTEYSAPEGTVTMSNDYTPTSLSGGGYGVKFDNSRYICANLPEGYTFQAGDKIIVTGWSGTNASELRPLGVVLADAATDGSTKNLTTTIGNKNTMLTLICDVETEDFIFGKRSVYVCRGADAFYVSSITIVRTVDNQNTVSSASDITITFDKDNAATLNLTDKVQVATTNADEMYVYWDNQADVADAKFTAATKHQITPYYTKPATTGNVYLHVKAVNLASGISTTATRNYKIFTTPKITVDNLIISAASGATAPKATVTYFNGVEDIIVENPNVTYTWKTSSEHIENPNGGTTITGRTQGKATVVAHYAGNDALALNAAEDVEFTVSVNLHLYFVADFGLGKQKDATDEKANGRVYNNGKVVADLGESDIELPGFTIKDRSDNEMTADNQYTITGPFFQPGSDEFVADLTANPVTINTGRPGSAMIKYVLEPSQAYKDKGYETTNIYIPVMIEETDESKFVALENGKHYRPLEKFEVDGCTMTLGGWNGYYEDGKTLSGNEDSNYKNESTSSSNVYGVTYPYTKDGSTTYEKDSWTVSSEIKGTISTRFKYGAAGTKNNNPRNEQAANPYADHAGTGSYIRNDYAGGEVNYGNYDLFGVPCRGDFVTFEPKADGLVTLHINQKTVLEDNSHEFADGRYFQIRDERGKFVMPITYCSNTDKINTPRFADFKMRTAGSPELTNDQMVAAIGVSQNEYELNQVLKCGTDKHPSPNFLTLYEGPATYTFEVKAGKTYYAYCVVSKMDVLGFEFHETAAAPTAVTLDDATGNINGSTAVTNAVTNMASVTYDRTMNADTWYPVVLPYSMNAKQVKYVFGDPSKADWRGDAEIIYFDHIDNTTGTIHFMSHFYKTIVAGVPCLVRPSKNVTSLSLSGCDYPYVTVETPATMTISAGNNGDGYNWISSYAPQTITYGDYYFSTDKEHNIKQMTATSANLKGFRALLKAPSPSAAKIFKVALNSFDETGNSSESGVDGIDYIIVDCEGNMNIATNNNIYNVNGQVVRAGSTDTTGLVEGVYIVNGKKVFVKK